MPNGSSSSSSLGESAKARAMPTRCFMPLESSAARRCMASPRPTRCEVVFDDVAPLGRSGLGIDAVDAESDVLARRQPRHQRGRLEDDGPIRPGAGDLVAVEHDAAARDLVEPRRHRQHRRLAAAGMADERDEFALLHLQVEAVDDGERPLRRGIGLANLEELDVALLDRGVRRVR